MNTRLKLQSEVQPKPWGNLTNNKFDFQGTTMLYHQIPTVLSLLLKLFDRHRFVKSYPSCPNLKAAM